MSPAAPFLVTERLELWQPRADDRAALHAIVRSEAVQRYLGPPDDEPGHFARFQRGGGSWWLHGYGSFVLRERGAAAIVGSAGIFHSWRGFGTGLDDVAEAGWIIAEPHWGRGYALEAMRAAVAWFDAAHGPRRIACMIARGNDRSFRLAEKLGFRAYDELEDNGETLVLLERPAA